MLTPSVRCVVPVCGTGTGSPCVSGPNAIARAFRIPPAADAGCTTDYSPKDDLSSGADGWAGVLRAYAIEVATLFEPNSFASSGYSSAVATETRMRELFPADRSSEGRAVAAGLNELYVLLRAQAAKVSQQAANTKLQASRMFSASSALAVSAAGAGQSLTEQPIDTTASPEDERPGSAYAPSHQTQRSPSPPLMRRVAPEPVGPTPNATPLPTSRLSTFGSATSFGSVALNGSCVDAASPLPVVPHDGPHPPPLRHPVRWSTSCAGSNATGTVLTPATARSGAMAGGNGRDGQYHPSTVVVPPPPPRLNRASVAGEAERPAASREREGFIRGVRPLETWMLSLKRAASPPEVHHNRSAHVHDVTSGRRAVPALPAAARPLSHSDRGAAGSADTNSGSACCFGDGAVASRSSVERERRLCYRSSSVGTASGLCAGSFGSTSVAPPLQLSQHHHRSGLPTGASAAAASTSGAAFASLNSTSLRSMLQQHRAPSPYGLPVGPPPTRHSHRTSVATAGGGDASGYVGVGSGMVGALGIAGRVDRAAAVRSGSVTTRTRPSSPCPLYGPLSQDKWSKQQQQQQVESRRRPEFL